MSTREDVRQTRRVRFTGAGFVLKRYIGRVATVVEEKSIGQGAFEATWLHLEFRDGNRYWVRERNVEDLEEVER